MDKYTPNQKMFYYRKKKEKKNSKPTNSFELYICTQQAIVCGWMMIFDALDISSNMVICLSPCTRPDPTRREQHIYQSDDLLKDQRKQQQILHTTVSYQLWGYTT